MECVKERISTMVEEVKNSSFDEKKNALSEAQINDFLDTINDFKKSVLKRATRIDNLTSGLEELTWFNDIDEECLKLINDIIGLGRDLYLTHIKSYVKINNKIRIKGIAVDEIKEYKKAIDDFKETINDIESIYFSLPNNKDFSGITDSLSKIL